MTTTNLVAGNVKSAMKGVASRDLWQVPIESLHEIPGFNIRVETSELEEHIAALANSIYENGFYQNKPLAGYVSVEDGKEVIFVADGHCRLEAARTAVKMGAEIKALPVVITPRGSGVEDLTVGLVTNNSGHPLTQFEIGVVCKRLMGYGWDEKTIAKRLGIETRRVSDLLGLVGADHEIRNLVTSGKVSASQAIRTMKEAGPEAKAKLKEGVAKAAARGKKRATQKHIETAKPSYKSVVTALLEWAKATEYVLPEDLKPVMTLARASVK